ncbi:MAG: hypothetical protein KGZ39_00405 [Simkania sp.]|nr:hypothetical protein [Simkania sp.]
MEKDQKKLESTSEGYQKLDQWIDSMKPTWSPAEVSGVLISVGVQLVYEHMSSYKAARQFIEEFLAFCIKQEESED